MDDSHSPQSNPEYKKVINLYGALGAALILSLIPSILVSLIAMFMFVAVLVAGYVMRSKVEANSLLENHATYIIRTIWIGSLFGAVTIMIGGIYLIGVITYDPLMPCADTLLSTADPTTISYAQLMRSVEPCMGEFMYANAQGFMVSGAIGILPILAYFGFRFFKGLARAIKGYRIASHTSWF